jgi:hypothetical protein
MRVRLALILFVISLLLLPSCWNTLEEVDPFSFPEEISPGEVVRLYLTGTSDTVVFKFTLTDFRTAQFSATEVPALAKVRVSFFTQERELLQSSGWGNYGESKEVVSLLEPGVYYAAVEITSPIFYSHQSYAVQLTLHEIGD